MSYCVRLFEVSRVLSIGSLSLGQTLYYERSVAAGADDYYAGRGESPGEWLGSGAGELGLSGTVTGEGFQALMAGRHPKTGQQLAKRGERSVAAHDLTFSAPKSVSVLYAVGGEEVSRALVCAHERAARAAVAFIEAEACAVRRGHAGAERAAGDGFVAAAYRHRMSRAADPQLHTHVVAANMTRGPDGRWTALDARPLFRHAKAAGFLYQAELRKAVREELTWAKWGPVRNGMAELEGIEWGVLREFSQRRRQIEEREAELVAAGVAVGDAGREVIAHDTRERKQYGIQTHSWRDAVTARAAEHGLGESELRALCRRRPKEHPVLEKVLAAEAERLVGPDGLTAQRNSFERRDVVIAFAQAAAQGAAARELRAAVDRFLKRPNVLQVHGGRAGAYTTAELVRCEEAVVQAAERRRGEGAGVVDGEVVDRVLGRRVLALTGEQEAAVRAVCGSGDGVEVIEALAGTGKTIAAGAIAAVYREAGWRVLGIAPTGRAVRELKERSGIEQSATLARLVIDFEEYGGFGRRPTVVVLDEASMASTRDVARLVEQAGRSGVKVVAIGDSGQLPSVQAGGWLGSLTRRQGAIRMVEVMRQRDPRERKLLKRLHGGAPNPYIEEKTLSGLMRVMEPADAERAAIEAWRAHAGEVGVDQAVLITRNNRLRERLNDGVRAERAGELGEQASFGELELAVGDRVICRQNKRRLDVDNGTRGTVSAVTENGITVHTDAGVERSLPAAYCAQAVEHAYALTAHGMQGGTVQWALVVASPGEMSRNWSYTALSRAREPTEIIVVDAASDAEQERAEIAPTGARTVRDPLGELARAMHRRDDEDLAIDQLDDHAQARRDPLETVVPGEPVATAELQAQLTELKRQITAATRQRSVPDPIDPQFEALIARQRELRTELAQRRERHIERALSDPPEHLIASLGPPPADPIARQRWDIRARQAEALRFESGASASTAPPTRGPARPADLPPPQRRGPSLGR
jgi:conjugative relaxase-like TrwC/TraI family protein